MVSLSDHNKPGEESPTMSGRQVVFFLLITTAAVFIALWIVSTVDQQIGIEAEFVETSAIVIFDGSNTGQGDGAEFTIVFDVTAKNGDVVISNVASTDKTDPSLGLRFKFGGEVNSWVAIVDHTGTNTDNELLVTEGETERFTLLVYANGLDVTVHLSQILWEANGEGHVYHTSPEEDWSTPDIRPELNKPSSEPAQEIELLWALSLFK